MQEDNEVYISLDELQLEDGSADQNVDYTNHAYGYQQMQAEPYNNMHVDLMMANQYGFGYPQSNQFAGMYSQTETNQFTGMYSLTEI